MKKFNTVHSIIACGQMHCIEARSVERIFPFIFQLSGWALVAPSCFMTSRYWWLCWPCKFKTESAMH